MKGFKKRSCPKKSSRVHLVQILDIPFLAVMQKGGKKLFFTTAISYL